MNDFQFLLPDGTYRTADQANFSGAYASGAMPIEAVPEVSVLSPQGLMEKLHHRDASNKIRTMGYTLVNDPKPLRFAAPDGRVGKIQVGSESEAFAGGGSLILKELSTSKPLTPAIAQAMVQDPESEFHNWLGPVPQNPEKLKGWDKYAKVLERNRDGRMGFWRGITPDINTIPFLGTFRELRQTQPIVQTAERLRDGKPVTDQEVLDLNLYLTEMQEAGDASFGGKVGRVIRDSLSYGMEFKIALVPMLFSAGKLSPAFAKYMAAAAASRGAGTKVAKAAKAFQASGKSGDLFRMFDSNGFVHNVWRPVAQDYGRKVIGGATINPMTGALVGEKLTALQRFGGFMTGTGAFALPAIGVRFAGQVAASTTTEEGRAALLRGNQDLLFRVLQGEDPDLALHFWKSVGSEFVDTYKEALGPYLLDAFGWGTRGIGKVTAGTGRQMAQTIDRFTGATTGGVADATDVASRSVLDLYRKKMSVLTGFGAHIVEKMEKLGINTEGVLNTFKDMGYTNTLGEMLKERYSGFMHGLFGWTFRDQRVGERMDDNAIIRAIKSTFPTLEELAVEAVAFSAPMAMSYSAPFMLNPKRFIENARQVIELQQAAAPHQLHLRDKSDQAVEDYKTASRPRVPLAENLEALIEFRLKQQKLFEEASVSQGKMIRSLNHMLERVFGAAYHPGEGHIVYDQNVGFLAGMSAPVMRYGEIARDRFREKEIEAGKPEPNEEVLDRMAVAGAMEAMLPLGRYLLAYSTTGSEATQEQIETFFTANETRALVAMGVIEPLVDPEKKGAFLLHRPTDAQIVHFQSRLDQHEAELRHGKGDKQPMKALLDVDQKSAQRLEPGEELEIVRAATKTALAKLKGELTPGNIQRIRNQGMLYAIDKDLGAGENDPTDRDQVRVMNMTIGPATSVDELAGQHREKHPEDRQDAMSPAILLDKAWNSPGSVTVNDFAALMALLGPSILFRGETWNEMVSADYAQIKAVQGLRDTGALVLIGDVIVDSKGNRRTVLGHTKTGVAIEGLDGKTEINYYQIGPGQAWGMAQRKEVDSDNIGLFSVNLNRAVIGTLQEITDWLEKKGRLPHLPAKSDTEHAKERYNERNLRGIPYSRARGQKRADGSQMYRVRVGALAFSDGLVSFSPSMQAGLQGRLHVEDMIESVLHRIGKKLDSNGGIVWDSKQYWKTFGEFRAALEKVVEKIREKRDEAKDKGKWTQEQETGWDQIPAFGEEASVVEDVKGQVLRSPPAEDIEIVSNIMAELVFGFENMDLGWAMPMAPAFELLKEYRKELEPGLKDLRIGFHNVVGQRFMDALAFRPRQASFETAVKETEAHARDPGQRADVIKAAVEDRAARIGLADNKAAADLVAAEEAAAKKAAEEEAAKRIADEEAAAKKAAEEEAAKRIADEEAAAKRGKKKSAKKPEVSPDEAAGKPDEAASVKLTPAAKKLLEENEIPEKEFREFLAEGGNDVQLTSGGAAGVAAVNEFISGQKILKLSEQEPAGEPNDKGKKRLTFNNNSELLGAADGAPGTQNTPGTPGDARPPSSSGALGPELPGPDYAAFNHNVTGDSDVLQQGRFARDHNNMYDAFGETAALGLLDPAQMAEDIITKRPGIARRTALTLTHARNLFNMGNFTLGQAKKLAVDYLSGALRLSAKEASELLREMARNHKFEALEKTIPTRQELDSERERGLQEAYGAAMIENALNQGEGEQHSSNFKYGERAMMSWMKENADMARIVLEATVGYAPMAELGAQLRESLEGGRPMGTTHLPIEYFDAASFRVWADKRVADRERHYANFLHARESDPVTAANIMLRSFLATLPYEYARDILHSVQNIFGKDLFSVRSRDTDFRLTLVNNKGEASELSGSTVADLLASARWHLENLDGFEPMTGTQLSDMVIEAGGSTLNRLNDLTNRFVPEQADRFVRRLQPDYFFSEANQEFLSELSSMYQLIDSKKGVSEFVGSNGLFTSRKTTDKPYGTLRLGFLLNETLTNWSKAPEWKKEIVEAYIPLVSKFLFSERSKAFMKGIQTALLQGQGERARKLAVELWEQVLAPLHELAERREAGGITEEAAAAELNMLVEGRAATETEPETVGAVYKAMGLRPGMRPAEVVTSSGEQGKEAGWQHTHDKFIIRLIEQFKPSDIRGPTGRDDAGLQHSGYSPTSPRATAAERVAQRHPDLRVAQIVSGFLSRGDQEAVESSALSSAQVDKMLRDTALRAFVQMHTKNAKGESTPEPADIFLPFLLTGDKTNLEGFVMNLTPESVITKDERRAGSYKRTEFDQFYRDIYSSEGDRIGLARRREREMLEEATAGGISAFDLSAGLTKQQKINAVVNAMKRMSQLGTPSVSPLLNVAGALQTDAQGDLEYAVLLDGAGRPVKGPGDGMIWLLPDFAEAGRMSYLAAPLQALIKSGFWGPSSLNELIQIKGAMTEAAGLQIDGMPELIHSDSDAAVTPAELARLLATPEWKQGAGTVPFLVTGNVMKIQPKAFDRIVKVGNRQFGIFKAPPMGIVAPQPTNAQLRQFRMGAQAWAGSLSAALNTISGSAGNGIEYAGVFLREIMSGAQDRVAQAEARTPEQYLAGVADRYPAMAAWAEAGIDVSSPFALPYTQNTYLPAFARALAAKAVDSPDIHKTMVSILSASAAEGDSLVAANTGPLVYDTENNFHGGIIVEGRDASVPDLTDFHRTRGRTLRPMVATSLTLDEAKQAAGAYNRALGAHPMTRSEKSRNEYVFELLKDLAREYGPSEQGSRYRTFMRKVLQHIANPIRDNSMFIPLDGSTPFGSTIQEAAQFIAQLQARADLLLDMAEINPDGSFVLETKPTSRGEYTANGVMTRELIVHVEPDKDGVRRAVGIRIPGMQLFMHRSPDLGHTQSNQVVRLSRLLNRSEIYVHQDLLSRIGADEDGDTKHLFVMHPSALTALHNIFEQLKDNEFELRSQANPDRFLRAYPENVRRQWEEQLVPADAKEITDERIVRLSRDANMASADAIGVAAVLATAVNLVYKDLVLPRAPGFRAPGPDPYIAVRMAVLNDMINRILDGAKVPEFMRGARLHREFIPVFVAAIVSYHVPHKKELSGEALYQHVHENTVQVITEYLNSEEGAQVADLVLSEGRSIKAAYKKLFKDRVTPSRAIAEALVDLAGNLTTLATAVRVPYKLRPRSLADLLNAQGAILQMIEGTDAISPIGTFDGSHPLSIYFNEVLQPISEALEKKLTPIQELLSSHPASAVIEDKAFAELLRPNGSGKWVSKREILGQEVLEWTGEGLSTLYDFIQELSVRQALAELRMLEESKRPENAKMSVSQLLAESSLDDISASTDPGEANYSLFNRVLRQRNLLRAKEQYAENAVLQAVELGSSAAAQAEGTLAKGESRPQSLRVSLRVAPAFSREQAQAAWLDLPESFQIDLFDLIVRQTGAHRNDSQLFDLIAPEFAHHVQESHQDVLAAYTDGSIDMNTPYPGQTVTPEQLMRAAIEMYFTGGKYTEFSPQSGSLITRGIPRRGLGTRLQLRQYKEGADNSFTVFPPAVYDKLGNRPIEPAAQTPAPAAAPQSVAGALPEGEATAAIAPDLFQMQNTTAERTIKSKAWGNLFSLRSLLENAGDIFREATLRADPGYIKEKLARIENFFGSQGNVSELQTALNAATPGEKDVLTTLLTQYKAILDTGLPKDSLLEQSASLVSSIVSSVERGWSPVDELKKIENTLSRPDRLIANLKHSSELSGGGTLYVDASPSRKGHAWAWVDGQGNAAAEHVKGDRASWLASNNLAELMGLVTAINVVANHKSKELVNIITDSLVVVDAVNSNETQRGEGALGGPQLSEARTLLQNNPHITVSWAPRETPGISAVDNVLNNYSLSSAVGKASRKERLGEKSFKLAKSFVRKLQQKETAALASAVNAVNTEAYTEAHRRFGDNQLKEIGDFISNYNKRWNKLSEQFDEVYKNDGVSFAARKRALRGLIDSDKRLAEQSNFVLKDKLEGLIRGIAKARVEPAAFQQEQLGLPGMTPSQLDSMRDPGETAALSPGLKKFLAKFSGPRTERQVGIVGAAGDVQAKLDTTGALNHLQAFGVPYLAESRWLADRVEGSGVWEVMWWAQPAADAANAVENFLFRKPNTTQVQQRVLTTGAIFKDSARPDQPATSALAAKETEQKRGVDSETYNLPVREGRWVTDTVNTADASAPANQPYSTESREGRFAYQKPWRKALDSGLQKEILGAFKQVGVLVQPEPSLADKNLATMRPALAMFEGDQGSLAQGASDYLVQHLFTPDVSSALSRPAQPGALPLLGPGRRFEGRALADLVSAELTRQLHGSRSLFRYPDNPVSRLVGQIKYEIEHGRLADLMQRGTIGMAGGNPVLQYGSEPRRLVPKERLDQPAPVTFKEATAMSEQIRAVLPEFEAAATSNAVLDTALRLKNEGKLDYDNAMLAIESAAYSGEFQNPYATPDQVMATAALAAMYPDADSRAALMMTMGQAGAHFLLWEAMNEMHVTERDSADFYNFYTLLHAMNGLEVDYWNKDAEGPKRRDGSPGLKGRFDRSKKTTLTLQQKSGGDAFALIIRNLAQRFSKWESVEDALKHPEIWREWEAVRPAFTPRFSGDEMIRSSRGKLDVEKDTVTLGKLWDGVVKSGWLEVMAEAGRTPEQLNPFNSARVLKEKFDQDHHILNNKFSWIFGGQGYLQYRMDYFPMIEARLGYTGPINQLIGQKFTELARRADTRMSLLNSDPQLAKALEVDRKGASKGITAQQLDLIRDMLSSSQDAEGRKQELERYTREDGSLEVEGWSAIQAANWIKNRMARSIHQAMAVYLENTTEAPNEAINAYHLTPDMQRYMDTISHLNQLTKSAHFHEFSSAEFGRTMGNTDSEAYWNSRAMHPDRPELWHRPNTYNHLDVRKQYVQETYGAAINKAVLGGFINITDPEGNPLAMARPTRGMDLDNSVIRKQEWIKAATVQSKAAKLKGDEAFNSRLQGQALVEELIRVYEAAREVLGPNNADKATIESPRAPSVSEWTTFDPVTTNLLNQMIQVPFTETNAFWNNMMRAVQWTKRMAIGFSGFFYIALMESSISASGVSNNMLVEFAKDKNFRRQMVNGVREFRRAREHYDPYVAARVRAMGEAGLRSTGPGAIVDQPNTVVERDILDLSERIRETKGDRAADIFHTVASGSSNTSTLSWLWPGLSGKKWSDAMFGWFSAVKEWQAEHIMIQQAAKEGFIADSALLVPIEFQRRTAQFMNDTLGGQNWHQYIWATPNAMAVLNLILFAPNWTFSAFQSSGLGRLTQRLLVPGIGVPSGTAYAPGQMPMVLASLVAMYAIVMQAIPLALQAAAYGAGQLMGGEDEDTPFPWRNDPTRRDRIDLTPVLRHSPLYRGDPTGKRRAYIQFAKQVHETGVLNPGGPRGWLNEPWNQFMRKLSMPAKIVLEQATGQSPGSDWDLEFKGKGFLGAIHSGEPGIKGLWTSRLGYTAQKVIPISFSQLIQNPEVTPAQFFAPTSKGLSQSAIITAMTQVLSTYASGKDILHIRQVPRARRRLDSLLPELMLAAERNGYDAQKLLHTARGQILSLLYRDMWDSLNRENAAGVNRAAASIFRVGGTVRGLNSSLSNRERTYGREVTQEQRQMAIDALEQAYHGNW